MLMPVKRPRGPVRRDPTRHQYAARGLAVVASMLLLLAAVQLRSSGVWGGPPQVSAELRNAGGSLAKGSDVKVHGVIVGRVATIGRGPDGGVRVEMTMDEDRLGEVPADVVARILPATVFGTSYVDLRPQSTPPAGTASVTALRPGAVVPADSAQQTLELQQALDDIDRLVKALGPAELATAIGAASVALQGRGEQLGAMAERLDGYLATFTPELATVRADLAKLADVLEVVDQIAPELLDATDAGLVALDTLVRQRDDLEAMLVNATSLAKAGNAFLAQNTEQLTRFIQNGYRLIDAVHDNRASGITAAIRANQRIAGIVDQAVDQGYLKVDSTLRLTAPGYYGAGDRPRHGGPQ